MPLSSQSRLFTLRTVLRNTSTISRPITSSVFRRASSSSLTNYNTTSPTSSAPFSSFSSSLNRISRETLHRLHLLSSLNPPSINSDEEEELIEELSELINLMDQVKDVTLPSSLEERSELLSNGLGGEDVLVSQESLDYLDKSRIISREGKKEVEKEGGKELEKEEKEGKELLRWSTNRLGDYYASRNKNKE